MTRRGRFSASIATDFSDLLDRQSVGRGLIAASLVREDGDVIVQADTGTTEELPPVPVEVLKTAQDGQPVLIPPQDRATWSARCLKLKEIDGAYLYTIRTVDPEVIKAVPDRPGQYRRI